MGDGLMSAEDCVAAAAELDRRSPALFDPEALYVRLDRARRSRHLSWRALCAAADVDPGVTSRLAYGTSPTVTNLARLLVWLGDTDIRPYLTKEN